MKNYTNFIFKNQIFEGKPVNYVRVRIFKRPKDTVESVFGKIKETDGTINHRNLADDTVTNYTYIVTSDGRRIRYDVTDAAKVYYVHIKLYITREI